MSVVTALRRLSQKEQDSRGYIARPRFKHKTKKSSREDGSVSGMLATQA